MLPNRAEKEEEEEGEEEEKEEVAFAGSSAAGAGGDGAVDAEGILEGGGGIGFGTIVIRNAPLPKTPFRSSLFCLSLASCATSSKRLAS